MILYVTMYCLIMLATWGAFTGFKRSHNILIEAVFVVSSVVLIGYGLHYLAIAGQVWQTGIVPPLHGGIELVIAMCLGVAKFVGVIRG